MVIDQITVKEKPVITIFTIGDSTMANKSLKNENIERGWGQMLPELLRDGIRVSNHAKNGRSSRSFINEGRWSLVLNSLRKGDYVFIQFGHNDEKPSEKLHTEPGSTFDDNLRRFVREARAKGAIPVLFNSIVRRNFPPTTDTEHQGQYEKEGKVLVDTHGKYLDSPRNVAKELNVPFIDMATLTHDWVMNLGVEKSKDYFMWVPADTYRFCPKGKVDNTHLNINGGRAVAEIAIKAVCEQVPALRPYVRLTDEEVRVAKYRDNKQCAISYTFDDGLAEQYTMTAPGLERRGFRGTFALNGSKLNDGAVTDTTRMTWAQVKELAERGHELSNHGWAHKNFARFPIAEIREDILKNDSIIEAKTGVRPRSFVYPNNNKKIEGRRIAVRDRVGTRTTEFAIGSKSSAEDLKRWTDFLMMSGDWGVGMTHGMTYGYDAFGNPERFWKHLDYVKKHADKIWVGTFQEVAAYEKEYKNIRLDIVKEKSVYKVTPSLDLDKTLFNEPLTMTVVGKKFTAYQDGQKLSVKKRNGVYAFDFNPYGGTIEIRF
ncbi:MAG: polysaccharide deacetylase family protein [Bacteroides sp.]|nr:polysaccharide deacetylase family protein [Bacteroides sp.]